MTSSQGAPTVSLTVTKTHDAIGSGVGTAYVQNHTTLSIKPVVTTKYGATAGTVRIVTPDGVLTTTSGTAKSILIKTAGSYVINASVTDSRGFVGTAKQTVSVTACEYPSATYLRAFRCTSAGVLNDDGTYIKVEAEATVTSYAQSYSITVEHRETGSAGAWVNGGTLTNGSLIMSRSGGCEAESSDDLRVAVADKLGQETSYNATVTSALYTIHRMAGGNGVAFGKVAEKTGVEVREDWPVYCYGQDLQHLLVDTAHPVGSILQSLDSTFNPNAKWPWTLWGKIENVFLLGAGNQVVGATGGTTKLTLDMLPQYGMRFGAGGGQVYNFQASGTSQISYKNGQDDFLPPYMAVNIWVRAK